MLFLSYMFERHQYENTSKENFETNANLIPQEEMKKYNVVFVGTIRNVEKYTEKALENIEQCGKKFKDFAVIIYENDSTDKTREILENKKKNNYHYIFEDNITEPKRTIRLTNGRNKIIDKLKEINGSDYYHYMIVLDMDDINDSGKFVETIDTCFKYDPETWDVLTGNQTRTYYDLWALRKKGIIEKDFWGEVEKKPQEDQHTYMDELFKLQFKEQGLIEVDSAFGGIGVYKITSFLDKCKYFGYHKEGNPDQYKTFSEKCEHVDFNECIKQHGGNIFINSEFYTY